jgi:hypothetical protein
MAEGIKTSGIVAILALTVSLATAGWSAFAFFRSSEIRPLPFEYFQFVNESGVPQLVVQVPVANLAYGPYDDVARVQTITIRNGERELHFVARDEVRIERIPYDGEGPAPALGGDCYYGGALQSELIRVCKRSESPVAQLPAGQVAVLTPLFELRRQDCGLDHCRGAELQFNDFVESLRGDITITYEVRPLRDRDRVAEACTFRFTEEHAELYRISGWFGAYCREAEA